MGDPEWARSEAFATEASRKTNFDAVEAGVTNWLAEHDREEFFDKARTLHVPCFPVYDAGEVEGFEQYKARGFFVQRDHPIAGGRIRMPGPPYLLSQTPARIRRPAPLLGQDNRKVYCDWLRFSSKELDALAAEELSDMTKLPFTGLRIRTWLDLRGSARHRLDGFAGARSDQGRGRPDA